MATRRKYRPVPGMTLTEVLTDPAFLREIQATARKAAYEAARKALKAANR